MRQTNPLWGLLIAHECSGPRRWKTDDIEFLQRLSVQLAIALQQSVAYEQLQNELAQRKRAESTLQKLIAGTSSVTGKAFFPAFAQNVAEVLDVRYALITEVDEDYLRTLGFWAMEPCNRLFPIMLSILPANIPSETGNFTVNN